MTAQHDESAESEKRLRYESPPFWDEASGIFTDSADG